MTDSTVLENLTEEQSATAPQPAGPRTPESGSRAAQTAAQTASQAAAKVAAGKADDDAAASAGATVWDLDNDALAHALSWLSHHHNRPRSAESLLAGQPSTGRLTPEGALRVLREAGFNAGLVQREIGEISSLLLPAVLLLADGDACIVVERRADTGPGSPGARLYDVVMPGREHHACSASESELQAAYTGTALVCTPQATAPASARAGRRPVA